MLEQLAFAYGNKYRKSKTEKIVLISFAQIKKEELSFLLCSSVELVSPLVLPSVTFLAVNPLGDWIGYSPALTNLDFVFHCGITISAL